MKRRSGLRKRKSRVDGFSLSFLDAISCGFGAIVMLLVLTKIGEPRALEQTRQDLEARVRELQQELHEIRGETRVLNRKLVAKTQQLSAERQLIARLRGDLTRIQGEFAATRQLSEVREIVEGRLLAAEQELTEEMKRLLGRIHRRAVDDAIVGGIPVR